MSCNKKKKWDRREAECMIFIMPLAWIRKGPGWMLGPFSGLLFYCAAKQPSWKTAPSNWSRPFPARSLRDKAHEDASAENSVCGILPGCQLEQAGICAGWGPHRGCAASSAPPLSAAFWLIDHAEFTGPAICCLITGCADASHGVQQMRKFTAMHSLQCSIIYNNRGTGVSKTRRIKLRLRQLNRLLRSRLSKSK